MYKYSSLNDFIYKSEDKQLYLGVSKKVKFNNIVNNINTPFYIYSKDQIRINIITVQKSFFEIFGDRFKLKIYFALKSNNNKDVIKFISNYCGFETVSKNEIIFLKNSIGVSNNDIIFTSEGITDNEVDYILKNNILFNIGSKYFLKFFKNRKVGLRFNTGIGLGNTSMVKTGGIENEGIYNKFGIPFDSKEQIFNLLKKYNIDLIALHHHVGSDWKDDSIDLYMEAFDILLSLYRYFSRYYNINIINLGGGYGVPDLPGEEKFNFIKFFDRIKERLIKNNLFNKIKYLYIEPGTYIISNAGIFVTQVQYVENKNGINFVYLNAGLSDFNSPMYYNYYHHAILIDHKGYFKDSKEKKRYCIVGNICESGDIFHKNIILPNIEKGDYIIFLNAGAYGRVMANEYNMRPLPMEVII